MAYVRFKLSEIGIPPATFATAATVPGGKSQTVANVASVAGHTLETANDRDALEVVAAERVAIAADGEVPPAYAEAFARMQVERPPKVPADRWQQAIEDAGRFLDQWGAEAARLGWPVDDLFGLHEVAPLSRMDHMGLCWGLRGSRVVELLPDSAATVNQRGARQTWHRPARSSR